MCTWDSLACHFRLLQKCVGYWAEKGFIWQCRHVHHVYLHASFLQYLPSSNALFSSVFLSLALLFRPLSRPYLFTNCAPSRSPMIQAPWRCWPLSPWWKPVGRVGPAEDPRCGRTVHRFCPWAQCEERGNPWRCGCLCCPNHHDQSLRRGPLCSLRLLSVSSWKITFWAVSEIRTTDPKLTIEGKNSLYCEGSAYHAVGI